MKKHMKKHMKKNIAWTQIDGRPGDQRLFVNNVDEDHIFVCDNSGKDPDHTEDGRLAVDFYREGKAYLSFSGTGTGPQLMLQIPVLTENGSERYVMAGFWAAMPLKKRGLKINPDNTIKEMWVDLQGTVFKLPEEDIEDIEDVVELYGDIRVHAPTPYEPPDKTGLDWDRGVVRFLQIGDEIYSDAGDDEWVYFSGESDDLYNEHGYSGRIQTNIFNQAAKEGFLK